MVVSKKMVLRFPHQLVDKPIIYRLIKDFDLVFNLLKADITPDAEGVMVLELSGGKEEFRKGVEYLTEMGVKIEPLEQDVKWIESKCIQCGVCVGICPTKALYSDPETRLVGFDEKKCVGCEICVKPCPTRAIEVHFE